MIRLTYISTCQPGITLVDVRAILSAAQRSNQLNDITGMLFWSGEYFMQMLEGERGAVTRCFQRVLQDKRHSDVELVSVAPAGQRWFADWSMGFTQLLASHRKILADGVQSFNPYLLDTKSLPEALAQLTAHSQSLRTTPQRRLSTA